MMRHTQTPAKTKNISSLTFIISKLKIVCNMTETIKPVYKNIFLYAGRL